MAFPNVSDIVATTIENRSGKIADNVTKNNALLARLQQRGKIRPFSGGSKILEETSFAENGNGSWYSGYDLLPVGTSDVLSAAEFAIKQYAVPVPISGLEMLQNRGKEQIIDLLEARLQVAESTMVNAIAQGIYGDGTGAGGKMITGLAAAVVAAPATGVYGGIDRGSFPFWRNQVVNATGYSNATLPGYMNTLWASLVRGKDRPDLIVLDNLLWGAYVATLQGQQRFTRPESAGLGFPSVDFMGADVVVDGGIGGFIGANVGYFLNTDYLFLRPHKDRNMVPLDPNKRTAVNQDAQVQILAWAGNMTSSGPQFQGYLRGA